MEQCSKPRPTTDHGPGPVTVTVAEAQRLSGLGRTTVYKLIAEKKLRSVTIGTRRLVYYTSLLELLGAGNRADA